MTELVEGHIFTLPHLVLGLLHESAFFSAKDVVGIIRARGFDEHAIFVLGERHQVPRLELEGFQDLARNHHLAALPDAADSLVGWGGLHGKRRVGDLLLVYGRS